MNQKELQSLLQKKYNEGTWNKILEAIFPSVSFFRQPEKIILSDENVKSFQQTGLVRLHDGKNLAVFEVKLGERINLLRNRIAVRNLTLRFIDEANTHGVLVVYDQGKSNYRFTFVARESGFNEVGEWVKFETVSKRFTYILGEGETCRTAAERFYLLSQQKGRIDLEDVIKAFSVEQLSKEFFSLYKSHYQQFVNYIDESNFKTSLFNNNEKQIRDFVKKMLGRIVFLYFVQRKGWLGASNIDYRDGDLNFMNNFWERSCKDESFYSTQLTRLFFEGINKKRVNDDFLLPNDRKIKLPYLNGGLFEAENQEPIDITFPPELFENLFSFLTSFNFTIDENDPDENEIGIDPEMLGHIFENLLEDNKDKGAFYTPKQIVKYMTQETLFAYLKYGIGGGQNEISEDDITALRFLIKYKLKGNELIELGDKTEELVDFYQRQITFISKNGNKINDLLDNVKICDPAIGSGAFPVGLLNEIYNLKLVLNNTYSIEERFEIKKHIIENSIYGVDIEKGAVDIARLRFWLSLIIEQQHPKPLPNFDYKIIVGNTLISKLNNEIINVNWTLNETSNGLFGQDLASKRVELFKLLSEEQKKYFDPSIDKKKHSKIIQETKTLLLITQLELMIKESQFEHPPVERNYKSKTKYVEACEKYDQTVRLKDTLEVLKNNSNKPDFRLEFFDWKLDFPEVMNETINEKVGFDIIIANPPWDVYEGKKKTEIKDLLEYEIYNKCKGGKINAYELFLAKTDTLLRIDGINCQIFQNSFLADNSSAGVRAHYLNNQQIISIDSFPERDDPRKRVFESVKMSVCILISKKNVVEDYGFTVVFHNDRTRTKMDKVRFLKSEISHFDPKNCVIPRLKENEKEIFRKYYRGGVNKSLSDHFYCYEGELNMTFHSMYMTDDVNNPLIVKGAQVLRYKITFSPSQGTVQYVDKKKYLRDYPGSQKVAHHKQKRIALQGITGANDRIRIISTIIDENVFCANSCNYIIKTDNTSVISLSTLLGIFNSTLTNWIFRKTSTNSNVNCYEVNNLKLPPIDSTQDEVLSNTVERILEKKRGNIDTAHLEQHFDLFVYKLYAITYDELLIIDKEISVSRKEYEDIDI